MLALCLNHNYNYVFLYTKVWVFSHPWLNPRDTSSCCMIKVPQPRNNHKALQIQGAFVIYFCEGCSSWKFTKCMKNMLQESSEKLNCSILVLGQGKEYQQFPQETAAPPNQCPRKPHLSYARGVNAFGAVYGMHHKKNQKVVGTGSCPLVCSSLVAASCGPTVGSWQKDESHMV